ncbi:YraN family protein [Corynebacterium liangguodongii]|uniref:UPF0102 protein C3E79_06975 n=1 Tax=Corynebacterium liangguodongii TaxID=2079535 RepID=A0A2S0WF14_9CORY|nr:YraN family protein [Corynebacterium liangguodongii]AWB84252.1 YraN family protein [Corynebacterium liangguodongii]PWC00261.1 YraN family protein [Corynebacterium liangguodongii]
MAHTRYASQKMLGAEGEGFAAGVYVGLGYELIDYGVRTRSGEIDVILRAFDGTYVFLEVKTRRGRRFGTAEAVTPKKLATMRRCAVEWLEGKPFAPARFDVAEVLVTSTGKEIRIFPGVEDGAC